MDIKKPNNWFINPTGLQAIILVALFLLGAAGSIMATRPHTHFFGYWLSTSVMTLIAIIAVVKNYFKNRKK
jgi:hypothetical protein